MVCWESIANINRIAGMAVTENDRKMANGSVCPSVLKWELQVNKQNQVTMSGLHVGEEEDVTLSRWHCGVDNRRQGWY